MNPFDPVLKNYKTEWLNEAQQTPGCLMVIWQSLLVMLAMFSIMALVCLLSFFAIGFFLHVVFGIDSGLCAIAAAVATLILFKVWALFGGAKRLATWLRKTIVR